MGPNQPGEALSDDVDLAARWLGSSVIAASDEAFGDKENLLKPEPAVFEPGRYGNRGEIVDGWETRRRRQPGHDWAIVRLGAPGIVGSIDVDTSFFTGNFPVECRIEGCGVEGYPSPAALDDPASEWLELVPRSPLRGDDHNVFPVSDRQRFSHVRLSTFPDGGIARLRVRGQIVPDPRLLDGLTVDLAGQELGGLVVASSDGFYTSARSLNRPDRARTMGEGWETRRRRDDGHDFVVVRLGLAGHVRQIVIDTAHFRYNASAEVAVHSATEEPVPEPDAPSWSPLLPRTALQPDTLHAFAVDSAEAAATALRIDAFPDGGLSRVRAFGSVDGEARRVAGYRWFNALPASQARSFLAGTGVSVVEIAAILAARPLAGAWPRDLPGVTPARLAIEGPPA